MRRVAGRLLGALLSAIVLVPALPGTALAADPLTGSLETVSEAPDRVQLRLRADELPPGSELDVATVAVRVGEQLVDATAVSIQEEPSATMPVRRVALVVDTSGSMAGDRMVSARAAAQAFVDAVPPDVEVALVGFSGTPTVLAALTPDRAAISTALPGLTATGETSLYDAVLTALSLLGADGERRLLVLSDGEDSASAASLDVVTAAVRRAGVGLDAVVLGDQPTAVTALEQLAGAGAGRVLQADSGQQAAEAFSAAARALSRGMVVDVPLPSDQQGRTDITVEVTTTTGELVRSSTSVDLPALAAPVVAEPRQAATPFSKTQPALWLGLLALFGGLSLALVLAVRVGDRDAVATRRVHEVIGYYGGSGARTPVADAPSPIGDGAVARAALAVAGQVTRSRSIAEKLALRLDRAQVRFTPTEWVVLHGGLSLGTSLVILLLTGVGWALVGAVLAAAVIHVWLSTKGRRRLAAFAEDMPDALQLVASGLSSGYSLAQAVDSAVRQGNDPIAGEFGRALAEARLGKSLEDALDAVADRMDSEDFRWVVMAVRVQRDVGGNLAEVIQTVCVTMRERGALRRQVKALSAEGRLSAVILILMPVLIGLYLAVANNEFFRPMYTTSVGVFLLGGSALALACGAAWMRTLVKVEM